ncbi:MAG: amino acid adenylation domain-containing protein, partial [Lutisporaceae bacterium]
MKNFSSEGITLRNSIGNSTEIELTPEIELCEADMLSEEEKKKILIDFNDTKAEYLKDKTIHKLFEEQVERIPDNIAVAYEDRKLTYRELNERANQVARLLNGKGIGEGDIVGLLVERSLEMVVGIMGILKAGGAYMPINPEYPRDRISYMINDSKAKAVLTQSKFRDRTGVAAEVIDLDDEDIYTADSSNIENNAKSNNAAYVIYTSGSTGEPKGVVVEHRALHNFLNTIYHRFKAEVGEKDRCLSLTNISFDVGVGEIFLPLTYGATLVLFENDLVLDIEKLANTIVNEKITYTYIPPTILKKVCELLLEHKGELALNKVLVGVEPIKDYVLEEYMSLNENMQVINGYGPTEATICATMYNYGDKEPCGRNVPIGSPLLNTQIYILDSSGKPVPVGMAGELCISGDNLARGYLYRPELTAEKFVENPFIPGERMYKTGDLARWLIDGNIEFLGRIDNQVKIRGYRIELGEIESQLLKAEEIKEAVVLDKQDGQGNKYLCAYIVSEREITVPELRKNLSQSLPDYMIPTYFIQIEKIPLTPNGKINRRALPEPDGEINTGVEYVAATNEIEEKLIKIWNEVLEVGRIGINDDFFTLGGHSLKAIKIVSIIQKELMADISVGEIFSHSTVRKLGEYIGITKEIIYSSIESVEERELYEVSSAQKRMFALNQFSKEETNYNIPYIMIFEGKLERNKVEESFKKLVQRHEAFRTAFELVDDEIMQRIHKAVEFKVEYKEVNTNSEETIKSEVEKFIKPFDLSKAPLLRVKLIRLEEEKYALMLDMHHIISDGTSVSIIMGEFTKLYKGENLEELRVQYKDYSIWENKMLASEAMKEHEEYWTNMFSDEIPVLNLPTDYPRPSTQSFEGESIGFSLDKELIQKLKKISKAKVVTLYMILLSAYNIVLSKYSGQEDIIIGSAAAGRPHVDLHNMVGMFVNTLALRNYPKGKKKFDEFLQEVKKNALSAYENQDYQFDKLVEKLDIRRDLSRSALLDTIFVLQNTDAKEIELENIRVREYEFKGKVSKFDMILEAEEKGEEIRFNLEYCTKLFKRETIERVIKHFINILKEVAENPEIELCKINMLSEEEKREVLVAFNDTKTEYPKDKTIYELFEEQVEKTPDNIAVVYENQKLTYRELNEKANSLARSLREMGVMADSIVGIMAEHSLEMIIGIVGILKAGGAYLPIDSDYPEDRIKYMLEDSKADILLTEKKFVGEISYEGNIINLNDEKSYNENKENIEKISGAESLAYIIYTSGTTGKPKGVAVTQKNVVRLVKNTNYIEFMEGDRLLQTGSVTFDASTFEIWGALLNGIKLYITSKDVILNGERLGEYLSTNKITVLWLTSPLFNKICEENPRIFEGLRCLLVGGDVVSPKNVSLVRKYASELTVVNGYGPTENTTFSTCYVIKEEFDENKAIPIGRPIANSTAYILDKDNNVVPIGVYGELCVGGDGLAKGYLNNEELTAGKFVENPYEAGQRMYRTGDLVRWLSDGNIEFLGRIDHQVKIRGFRIELGEIEISLLKLDGVKEAVVIDREEEGNKYLCAYLVSEAEYSAGKLREELKKCLPDYMIPSYFITLPEMPLNQNGKIDRKALPIPDGSIETGAEYIAASNEIEKKLISIWSEVLGVEKIGINDNFFELGGHSLKAIKIVSIIQRELMVEISVGDIFRNPTVRELGEYIGKTKESVYSSIEAVEERELYEVSSAQKRMFALNQFSRDDTNYNIPSVMILEGKLDRSKLEESFNKLVQRHEAFRTSFELVDDEIMQRIHKAVEFKVEYEEINKDSEETIKSEVEKFIKPFDLSKAPLLRVKLIRLEEEKYVLMFDMHHIISDGTSMDIIMDE